MIEFKENFLPERRQTALTAFVNETELLMHGERIAKQVIQELIKQSVIVHRIDLENIVNEFIRLPETRQYVESKIRECIDKAIQAEIDEMFRKDK